MNWKHKDCAVYLVVSLATKKAGASSVSTDLVDMDSFIGSVIVPKLRIQDLDGFPMLKTGALKFITMFRNQISNLLQWHCFLMWFASLAQSLMWSIPMPPAALRSFCWFKMTGEGQDTQKPESEENQYVRVLGVANVSHEVAVMLYHASMMILSRDVSEFFPYAFQLLARLVDLNRSPLPGSYMEIFAILLLPESWKKSGNVPDHVQLLQAFLRKAPHELNQQGRLFSVLGISTH
ncbi:Exportin-2 [Sesamum alatum]|uniref:Exportin-2 n=1 Tax=Sesamum alatum TaxID=300844 RepID=A0AAE2CBA4_9LAMI|nr:Exportin-2 [Sesamum alatum]